MEHWLGVRTWGPGLAGVCGSLANPWILGSLFYMGQGDLFAPSTSDPLFCMCTLLVLKSGEEEGFSLQQMQDPWSVDGGRAHSPLSVWLGIVWSAPVLQGKVSICFPDCCSQSALQFVSSPGYVIGERGV